MKECAYLGHVVGDGTVKREHGKEEAAQSFLTPKHTSPVRAFLDLIGYYRRFIPDYSRTDLTKKCAPMKVVWSEACATDFYKLPEIHTMLFLSTKEP